MSSKSSGKDGKGGAGIGLDDFRLWKEFTRDIDPLDDPDWEALEELIRVQSPGTKILREAKGSTVLPPADIMQAKPPGPRQPPQLDARTEARLRRGKLPIEGTLDLHGYTQEPAHRLLTDFVMEAYGRGKRCLLIITGKGRSAAGGGLFDVPEGVLKQKVPQWLSVPPLSEAVLKVLPATQGHGGSGALYVYLRRKRG
jgi:DNA-nicking Smr family endonuclease